MSSWRREQAGHWMRGALNTPHPAPFGLHLDLQEVCSDLDEIRELLDRIVSRFEDNVADDDWPQYQAVDTVRYLIESAAGCLEHAADLHVRMFPT